MSKLTTLILAAGKGTRMESELPKVLHLCCGKPMVSHVIDAARGAGADRVVVIAGYKSELVHEELKDTVLYAEQTEQLGTGHAVMCASDQLPDEGETLILCGDTPLVTAKTLKNLPNRPKSKTRPKKTKTLKKQALKKTMSLLKKAITTR